MQMYLNFFHPLIRICTNQNTKNVQPYQQKELNFWTRLLLTLVAPYSYMFQCLANSHHAFISSQCLLLIANFKNYTIRKMLIESQASKILKYFHAVYIMNLELGN